MKKKRIKMIIIIILILAFSVLSLLYYQSNFTISSEVFGISDAKIPAEFEGYRITQISDLHSRNYTDGGEKLLSLVKEQKPDIIVITGDFIDRFKTDITPAINMAKSLADIAPVYYVNGNHEHASGENYNKLLKSLKDIGVNVLEDKSVLIKKDSSAIELIGLNDISFRQLKAGEEMAFLTADKIKELKSGDYYTVLLTHRPDLIKYYSESGANLVFCGHVHGGQIRLPFAGGLYSPDQGFFPKYTNGLYEYSRTKMLVSRGLGFSSVPARLNNTPEIITAVLHSSK